MTPNWISCAVEARDQRDLAAIERETYIADELEAEAIEELRFIDILDEMSELDESLVMNRLIRGRPNASADIHEILKAAKERAVKNLMARLAKESR